jgi:hypothetical protein
MVDSINPKNNTGSPDDPIEPNTSRGDEKPVSDLGAGGGFYRGFDQPDPVKVNLAGAHQDFVPGPKKPPVGILEEIVRDEPEEPDLPPKTETETPNLGEIIQDTIEPAEKPEPPKHVPAAPMPVKPMKLRVPINWKPVLAVFVSGIILAAVTGAGSFFGFGFYYDSKINSKEDELKNLETEKNNLGVAPKALELPAQEVPTPSAPAPAEPEEPAPAQPEPVIQQPQPETPPTGSG